MSDQTLTGLYEALQKGLGDISDLMRKYSEQSLANNHLNFMMQMQIIELKKRIDKLESDHVNSTNSI